jgi:phage shock protein A
MGILGRLSTLVKSNVNDLIDSMQDPAKEIDQMVLDMEDSARQARTEVAQCMAEEKRLAKRVEQLAGEATTWEEHAMRAVKAGDDVLAREALKRKAEKEADRLETEKALNEQKAYVDQLTAGLKALDARVKEVKMRQGTLREKARASKGKSPTSTKTSAFDDFERMSGKIDAVEAEAGLAEELSGDTPQRRETDRKLRELTEDKSMDDALAELKKKLGE